jgi:predicted outer membrane repeat protein
MFTKAHSSFGTRAALILILMIGMLGISPANAVLADTLVVTNMNDSGAGSLRQAIINSVSGDTITFDASLAGETITLSATLVIDKDLTIDGSSLSSKISVSGNDSVSVFIVNSEVTVLIKSLIIKDGGQVSLGAGIFNDGTLTVTNSLLSGNQTVFDPTVLSGGFGGAIYNIGDLRVTNSTFSENTGSRGGAIYCSDGTMTVVNSTFVSNSVSSENGDGGAIFDSCDSRIANSTFSSNSAEHNGGALLTDNNLNPVVILNSTFYANTAVNVGGGIANAGRLSIKNSTFSNNNAPSGGAIRNGLGGVLSLRNSILANSVGGVDCIKSDSTPAVANVNSLIETTGTDLESCGSSLLTSDPVLGPLQDNGGFTKTMALLPGSPAINAGTNTGCPATDQRGLPRPQGSHCDIGAHESPNMITLRSGGAQDGRVLETSENSSQGGVINAVSPAFVLGDHASNRQHRSILHFDTSSLPDNAVIARVTLKIRRGGVSVSNPFDSLGKVAVDIRQGAFGSLEALQAEDFQAPASKPVVGLIPNNQSATGWFATRLKATAHPFVNRTGVTQLRLRFQLDDDNDLEWDVMEFFSGDAAVANRPVLVIEYYVP